LISWKFSRSLSFKEQHRHVDQGRVVGTPSGWKGSCRWWTWSGKFMKVQALKRTNEFLANTTLQYLRSNGDIIKNA
jgi:hypothetical protein